MNFCAKKTGLDGLLEIDLNEYKDSRGYFSETYKKSDFADISIDTEFVQDNESSSKKGVLRGLHFQIPPYAQCKLVRVVRGKIKDVVVDIRKSSLTYGKWKSFILENGGKMLWVPEGFAHGFLSLEDDSIVQYKLTEYYMPNSQLGIAWDDPDLAIDWGKGDFIISEKDRKHPLFKDINYF